MCIPHFKWNEPLQPVTNRTANSTHPCNFRSYLGMHAVNHLVQHYVLDHICHIPHQVVFRYLQKYDPNRKLDLGANHDMNYVHHFIATVM